MNKKRFIILLVIQIAILIFFSIKFANKTSSDDFQYEDESSEAFEGEVWSDSLDTYLENHPE